MRATAVVIVPAALGYLVLSRPMVRLLLEHGVVTPRSGRLVADILVAFAVGLFPFSAFQLLLRAFYAMQDTRTPALVNVASLVVNVIANVVLFFAFDLGVQGLALGHAASYAVGSALLLVLIRRRLGGLDGRSMLPVLGRVVVAAAATACAAWLVATGLAEWVGTATLGEQALQVLAAVGAGLVVFLVAATLLRIEDVTNVRRQLAGRWRR